MARIPLIVGNWKMHMTLEETTRFCVSLKQGLAGDPRTSSLVKSGALELAVAPPFISLAASAEALRGSSICVTGQDVFWADTGAYTGEISSLMLRDAGCRFALAGHSERRQYFQETDEEVNRKAAALLRTGLSPIVCVGETLSERQGGAAFQVIEQQVRAGLKGLAMKSPQDLVIAYEPVWAIGTGQTATPEQAEEAQAFIRKLLEEMLPSFAPEMRILYGGSVKPDNISKLMAMPDVDGGLVGGASLDSGSFLEIARGACPRS
jgi:triosephosphate isomerase (TIM)